LEESTSQTKRVTFVFQKSAKYQKRNAILQTGVGGQGMVARAEKARREKKKLKCSTETVLVGV